MQVIVIDMDKEVSIYRISDYLYLGFCWLALSVSAGLYLDFSFLVIAGSILFLGGLIYAYYLYFPKTKVISQLMDGFNEKYPDFRIYKRFKIYMELMEQLEEWVITRQPYEPLILKEEGEYHLYVDTLPGRGDFLSKRNLQNALDRVN